jgi:N-acetylglucosaminyl-diphospho-decaprenol L-rhamnosyltransferase
VPTGVPPPDAAPNILDVSILVVSFNTRELTRECLESVYRETKHVSFEIIVVDNMSGDGSAEMVAEQFPQVHLIASAENLGFGRASNLAAASAHGAHYLLLNPDTVVLRGAIDELVGFALAHPEAGIYGGRSVFADGTLNPQCCWGRPTLWSEFAAATGLSSLFPRSTILNPRYMGVWQRDSVRPVDVISGSFLLVSADLWRRLGGFDTRFFMYGEDVDLCLRAQGLGHTCLFTPDAEIIHHGAGSEPVAVDKMIRLLRAKAQFYDKHWSRPSAGLGVRLLDLRVLSRLVALRLLGRPDHRDWRAIWDRRGAWRHPDLAEPQP